MQFILQCTTSVFFFFIMQFMAGAIYTPERFIIRENTVHQNVIVMSILPTHYNKNHLKKRKMNNVLNSFCAVNAACYLQQLCDVYAILPSLIVL